MNLRLVITKNTDIRLLDRMHIHYSNPKGFIGRNICYAILFGQDYYGHIVGGSATIHLGTRDKFFGIPSMGSTPTVESSARLNGIVNNKFFNCAKVGGTYPMRNFTTRILREFRLRILDDWKRIYGDDVIGYETLIELPRTGECYLRDGWVVTGETKGERIKTVRGKYKFAGVNRFVMRDNLKPKLVMCRTVDSIADPLSVLYS